MKRLLMCAVMLAWSGMASAVVYKWVDAQGKVQYGDRPPAGVHAEVVELLGTHVTRAAPAAASQPGPALAPSAPAKDAPRDAVPKDAARQAVDSDVAQSRDKQCTDAQEGYKKLIEGRRLYKAGPTGERQYLTSEEIDSERLNAKQAAESICNSPT